MTEQAHPNPFFSVVIPAYNRAHVIQATLDTVLAQTDQDFECIIVDDGSDDSAELSAVIDRLQDPRFIYIHQENGGGGAARNTGTRAATGAYIAFLDSDDFFLPEKLEKYRAVITDDPTRGYYSFMNVDRGVGKYWVRPTRAIGPDEDMGEYLFVANEFVQTSTIVLPRQAALATPFDPTLRKGQDLDLCLQLHRDGIRFTMIPEALTVWNDQSEEGRTSRHAGYEAPLQWLERSKSMMTEKAIYGYQANILAYYMAKSKPVTALSYLWKGYSKADISAKVILRQLLRGFLPRRAYRQMVAIFVAMFGKRNS